MSEPPSKKARHIWPYKFWKLVPDDHLYWRMNGVWLVVKVRSFQIAGPLEFTVVRGFMWRPFESSALPSEADDFRLITETPVENQLMVPENPRLLEPSTWKLEPAKYSILSLATEENKKKAGQDGRTLS